MSCGHMLITGLLQQHTGQFSRLVSPLQSEPSCSLSHSDCYLSPCWRCFHTSPSGLGNYNFFLFRALKSYNGYIDEVDVPPRCPCWGTTPRVNLILYRLNEQHISSANTPQVITLFRAPAFGERGAETQVGHFPAAGTLIQLGGCQLLTTAWKRFVEKGPKSSGS